MKWTDIFIKRPVLSSVLSLLILVIGLASMRELPLQQYPTMDNTTIYVSTAYPGASSQVIQSAITDPLSKSIASAQGINFMTADSSLGQSKIAVHMNLGVNPDAALAEVTSKVNASLYNLPKDAYSPTITKATGDTMATGILSLSSETLSSEEITAFIKNVIVPNLNNISSIGKTDIWGQKDYAMRIWLDPNRMAQLNISSQEVRQALRGNNIQATAGQIKTDSQYIDIILNTDLHSEEAFKKLVVRNEGGHIIHLEDIARVELGSKNYGSKVLADGKDAVFAAAFVAPGANPLNVSSEIRKFLPVLERQLPPGLDMVFLYDATDFIRAALYDVAQTLLEAILIVLAVIFLFLGAPRAVIIPVVTIPLSLIGSCAIMLMLGFSINLLTLLAMILAIGLVVDDAIVVLENIYRHIEEGMEPTEAAIQGAREISNPVIVMTMTLAAVYAPVGFIGGITGALFLEFAFTLAASVIISGVVALTLSPMLCASWIDSSLDDNRFVRTINHVFDRLKKSYTSALSITLSHSKTVLCVIITLLLCTGLFFKMSKQELAPTEDSGFLGVVALGPSPSTLSFLERSEKDIVAILDSVPEKRQIFQLFRATSPNVIFSGLVLTPWDERTRSAMDIRPDVTEKLSSLASVRAFAYEPPPLPGVSSDLGMQFVVKSTLSHAHIYDALEEIKARAQASGVFSFMFTSLQFDKPELVVDIDRDKAASMGIPMSEIADVFATMTNGGLINYFSQEGYNFAVIPQTADIDRASASALDKYSLNTSSGTLVPLSSVASFRYQNSLRSLSQFQQLNSGTLSAGLAPGTTMGKAVQTMESIASEVLPSTMGYDYSGSSRQYIQEGNTMMFAFALALVTIFLVLSAQFESYRDPLIIMVSVPLSIFGAMLPIFLEWSSLNIYTQIGMVTLIGLITKHGILIVEFANQVQVAKLLTKREAVIEAAAMRLRPILMTTAAMVCGVIPLIHASGAGAISRNHLGLTIFWGMLVGTLFTLFVVPTVYQHLAKDHKVGV